MSTGSSKRIRRQIKKNTTKIQLGFLKSIEKEPLGIRLKLAFRIIFKWNPGHKKNTKRKGTAGVKTTVT